MIYRKILHIITPIVILILILLDSAYPDKHLSGLILIAVYLIMISERNNYWFYFIFEGIILCVALVPFMIFRSGYAEFLPIFISILVAYILFINFMNSNGYPFKKTTINDKDE